jgi:NADP-dependent alcohol dehydrogenase
MVKMNNFEFYNPVKIIFGKGEIAKLKTLIPVGSRVLMTYGGGSIKSNGVYDQVRTSLADHTVFEFGGIEANPKYETLMKGVELARSENIGFLLAVGGGSVIDGTKFISAAINFKNDPWDILSNRAEFADTVDIGTVLTLPATGSEMNCFSVITRGTDKLGFGNPQLFPKFSILDPEVTFSLSEKQLGNGLVDAFVHTTEQYLTKNVNTPLQDAMAEGILKTLIEESDKVIHVKEDYESRANFMWSATMALNGLIGSGVVHDWATHMIGHELTALYGVDHARSLAVVLPSLLRELKDQKKEKLLQFATRVWGITDGSDDEKIESSILMTEDFFNKVGVPTKLKVYKIEEKDLPTIADAVRSHIPVNLGENKNIDKDMVIKILARAL